MTDPNELKVWLAEVRRLRSRIEDHHGSHRPFGEAADLEALVRLTEKQLTRMVLDAEKRKKYPIERVA